MRVRDADVGGAVEQSFEGDAGFRSGEGGTDAAVDAVAERDVLSRVGTVGPELVGALELAGVAVRGADEHHGSGSGAQVDAADGGGRS